MKFKWHLKSSIFCCDAFTNELNEAGCRGFSIVPSAYFDTFGFFLQARKDDYIDENNPGAFVVQTNILYCPWCGCKLAKVAAKYKDEIIELAKKNNHLVLDFPRSEKQAESGK